MLRIVVVAYKNACQLQLLFDSISRFLKISAELVVINNSPEQRESFEALRSPTNLMGYTMVHAPGNLGFGKATNLAARTRTGEIPWEHLLLLNPDAELLSNFDSSHLASLNALNAVCGLRVFNDKEKHERQFSARSFPNLSTSISGREGWLTKVWPTNPWSQKYLSPVEGEASSPVDWVSGCALFVPRAQWERLKGFDERFFLYCEDVDLGRRAKLLGIPVFFAPFVDVLHAVHGSARSRPIFADFHHHLAMTLYFLKWSSLCGLVFSPIIVAGIWMRFALRQARLGRS